MWRKVAQRRPGVQTAGGPRAAARSARCRPRWSARGCKRPHSADRTPAAYRTPASRRTQRSTGVATRAGLAVDEALQLLGAAGVAQFAQGLGFDLADALSSYGEVLAYFFQRMFGSGGAKSETHLDHLLFARR